MCDLIQRSEGKGARQEMERQLSTSPMHAQKSKIVVALMNLTALPRVAELHIALLSVRRLVRAVR